MRHRLLFTALCAGLSFVSPAMAASEFFLQLGAASSSEEAKGKWEELQKNYPAALATLEFSPRTITPVSGGASEVRIQAGPLRTREQAQRACNRLKAKEVDCFIVETIITSREPVYAGVSSAMPPVERASAQPVAVQAASVSEEAAPVRLSQDMPSEPVANAVPLPWLTAPASPQPLPEGYASVQVPSSQVEVADVIQVPVADSAPAPAPEAVKGEERLVQVAGFDAEQGAYNFSKALHTQLADNGATRMRITRPLSGNRGVTLAVGPVDAATATRVCDFAATQQGLQCGGASAAPTTIIAATPSRQPEPMLEAAPARPSKYWAQLGSWRTQAEASRRWEALQEAHGTLLKGYNASYQTPPRSSVYAKPSIRLRVGPFISREASSELCGRLSAHNVNCLVVAE